MVEQTFHLHLPRRGAEPWTVGDRALRDWGVLRGERGERYTLEQLFYIQTTYIEQLF
jgi:hypothetical protein